MHKITELSWSNLRSLIKTKLPANGRMYGIPRGGAIVAALSGREANTPEEADFFVDDIIDSGKTRTKWQLRHPDKPFYALVDKLGADKDIGWVKFPFEEEVGSDAEDSVVRLLQFIGEDPRREGLKDTPRRVVKAWKEMTVGYGQDPAQILSTVFTEKYDEIVAVPSIEFVSMCEHHCLSFSGHAHVGYLPDKNVVGLSKLARLVDCFARRLQIQEKMTRQISDAIQEYLKPRGVAVIVEAKHSCMSCRGVMKQDSAMVTSAMLGVFSDNPAARAEFMELVAPYRK